MSNLIFFSIMCFYVIYINCSWQRHCDKMNDRWAEEYNKLNAKWSDICHKIIEEEKTVK